MQFTLSVFGIGVLGGLVGELIKLWDVYRQVPPPAYLKSLFYWALVVVMSLIGGVLAVFQNVDPSQPLVALNIGISAPLILKGLASAVPKQQPSGAGGPAGGSSGSYNIIDMIAGR